MHTNYDTGHLLLLTRLRYWRALLSMVVIVATMQTVFLHKSRAQA